MWANLLRNNKNHFSTESMCKISAIKTAPLKLFKTMIQVLKNLELRIIPENIYQNPRKLLNGQPLKENNWAKPLRN